MVRFIVAIINLRHLIESDAPADERYAGFAEHFNAFNAIH